MPRRVSVLRPEPGETLSAFLDRCLETRGLSLNALSRKLADTDGLKQESAERSVKRWTASPRQLTPKNAERLGQALNADFSSFLQRYERKADWQTAMERRHEEVLERVGRLEKLVEKLARRGR